MADDKTSPAAKRVAKASPDAKATASTDTDGAGSLPAGANQDTQGGRAAAKKGDADPGKVATTTADAGDAGHPGGDPDGADDHKTPDKPVTAPDAPPMDPLTGLTMVQREALDKPASDIPTEQRAPRTEQAGVAGREGDKDEQHLPPPNTVQWGIEYAEQARSSSAPIDAPGGKTQSRSTNWGTEAVMSNPEVTAFGKETVVEAPTPRLAPDYSPEQYVGDDGKPIKSSAGVFDESGDGTTVKVKKGVWEDILPRNARTTIRRRVFAVGQDVPRSLVEQFGKVAKGDADDRDLII
jgi:hypothetical protein